MKLTVTESCTRVNFNFTQPVQLLPTADLAITKTDGVTSVTPGGQTVYTIVASNIGPAAVTGAVVADQFAAAITAANWTCTSAGGASCPNASGSGNLNETVNLPVGGSLSYKVTALISPNATGTLTNTATITPPEGVVDPVLTNNTATDSDTLDPKVDLVVQKNGTGVVQVNGAVNYTVEVTNLGPSSADNTDFADTLPATLTSAAAVCTSALSGAVCPASLTVSGGSVTGTIPTLPPGGNLVITITGNAPASIGTMTNVATATPPSGVTELNPDNNVGTASTDVVNAPIPAVANLAVTKVGSGTVPTGGTISYVVTVTNAGPSAANNALFSDTVPAAITSVTWACQAAGGAVCPNGSGSSNAISETIATFPANGQLIYTITGTAPASAQVLTNTATIAAPSGVTDPDLSDNTASQPTTIQAPAPKIADLVIAKTGPANVASNAQMTYTLVVTNKGPSAADGAVVSDNLPDVLSSVSAVCAATGGAVCGATNVVSGNQLNGTITKLPAGGIVTYTITATAPTSGSFANSATVTPPAGVIDPDPGDNTGGPVVTTIVVPPLADLSLTKTVSASASSPGSTLTYTIQVSNAGPMDVTGATITDVLSSNLTGATWTCSASSGSSCPASGSGNLSALSICRSMELRPLCLWRRFRPPRPAAFRTAPQSRCRRASQIPRRRTTPRSW